MALDELGQNIWLRFVSNVDLEGDCNPGFETDTVNLFWLKTNTEKHNLPRLIFYPICYVWILENKSIGLKTFPFTSNLKKQPQFYAVFSNLPVLCDF